MVGSPKRYKGVPYEINAFHRHGQYDPVKVIHDIGLIQLEKSLEFSHKVLSIQLNRNFIDGSMPVVVAGFGQSLVSLDCILAAPPNNDFIIFCFPIVWLES